MNFDDLKDQLVDAKENLIIFIQEDPSVNSIKEKYQTLSSPAQKGLVAGLTVFALLVLFYIPYSYFSAASDLEEEYNSYKVTIRELLKVGVGSSTGSLSTRRGDLDSLKSKISSTVNNFNLTPGQVTPVILSSDIKGSLAHPPVNEEVFTVLLKNLNLNQIIQIGTDLQRKFNNLKMTGLSVTASSGKTGYFNTQFMLSKYYLPSSENTEEKTKKNPKRRKRKKRN